MLWIVLKIVFSTSRSGWTPISWNFGSRQQLGKVTLDALNVCDIIVGSQDVAKDLGVLWDSQMTIISQIANVCKTSTLHLRNIMKIRKYLSTTALKCIIHSFVTTRLDSNNALLYNIPNCHLHKLQRVQNWAAKVILGGKKYYHVSPLLKELHWLPVVKRVQFKILLLCYRCLDGSASEYLTSLLSPHKPPLNLRSGRDVLNLNVPCSKRLWGDRAFSVAALQLWNHPFS